MNEGTETPGAVFGEYGDEIKRMERFGKVFEVVTETLDGIADIDLDAIQDVRIEDGDKEMVLKCGSILENLSSKIFEIYDGDDADRAGGVKNLFEADLQFFKQK